jgi:hypothetical protein
LWIFHPHRVGYHLEPTPSQLEKIESVGYLLHSLVDDSENPTLSAFRRKYSDQLNSFFETNLKREGIEDMARDTAVRFVEIQSLDPDILRQFHSFLFTHLNRTTLPSFIEGKDKGQIGVDRGKKGGSDDEIDKRPKRAKGEHIPRHIKRNYRPQSEIHSPSDKIISPSPRKSPRHISAYSGQSQVSAFSQPRSSTISRHATRSPTNESSKTLSDEQPRRQIRSEKRSESKLSNSLRGSPPPPKRSGHSPITNEENGGEIYGHRPRVRSQTTASPPIRKHPTINTPSVEEKEEKSHETKTYRFFFATKIKPLKDIWPSRPPEPQAWPKDTDIPSKWNGLSCQLSTDYICECGSSETIVTNESEFEIEYLDQITTRFFRDHLMIEKHSNYIFMDDQMGPIVCSVEDPSKAHGDKVKVFFLSFFFSPFPSLPLSLLL